MQIQNKQQGQGMTEYIVIVALIAVAAIAVYQFFGQTIRSQTSGIALEVSGQKGGDAIAKAQASANSTVDEREVKGLGKYTNDSANTTTTK